jgi:hypothetical protein
VKEERVMEQSTTPQEFFSQLTGKTIETMTLWAEAQQRVLKEFTGLVSDSAKESARLYAEIQQNTLTAVADAPMPLPWQFGAWQEGYQRALKVFESNVQAVSRSAERLHASAEVAGKGLQETFATVSAKMKDTYGRN